MYHHDTGYVGNLKSIAFKDLQAKKPEEIINKAVRGMLPKGLYIKLIRVLNSLFI
jgi:large subunit ribosomal protein L13